MKIIPLKDYVLANGQAKTAEALGGLSKRHQ